jgi:hypothetical protein
MISKLKLLLTNPLKALGFVTLILGLGVIIITKGYLLILGIVIIGAGWFLYLVNYFISKLNGKANRCAKWGISITYLLLCMCSYLKWQEHTTFTFPNRDKNAGIIFGIEGYPKLPATIFWSKSVTFPPNGFLITSTKEEEMPTWQRYRFADGTTPKSDSDVVWNPDFTYNCIINNKVIKAWTFTLQKDTGLLVQRAIATLGNQVNEGKAKTNYYTTDRLIVNSKDGDYLSLQGKGLSFLPDAVSQLHVNTVYLANNHFRTIPLQLYKIPGLHDVYLSANPIEKLPNDLYKIKSLKSLLVSKTLIKDIKVDLSGLDSLTYFDISDNGLTVFPKQIKAIPHLQSLSIQENEFTDLSFLDGNLQGLETLHVYSNKLTGMSGIGVLVNLKELLIFDNKLDSIPDKIANLTRLEKLEIWNNPIHYISPKIKKLIHLKELRLDDNYLTAKDKMHLKEWLPKCVINFQTR